MSGSGDSVRVTEGGGEVYNEFLDSNEGDVAFFVCAGHYLVLGLAQQAGDSVENFAELIEELVIVDLEFGTGFEEKAQGCSAGAIEERGVWVFLRALKGSRWERDWGNRRGILH